MSATRKLVVAQADGGDARADLRQRGRDRQDGGAEDDAVDVRAVGEVAAGHLEHDAGDERDDAGDAEDGERRGPSTR